ncbi:MAG: hypothetical protein LLG20_12895 [Acidobacteriales bacterium]|nr:hypothetical protein [Terriglobales bacterium]
MSKLISLLLGCGGAVLLVVVYWAGWKQGKESLKISAGFQLPTATESFGLRSRCAELGQKIVDENVIGIALTQGQVSHYDPTSNRCYVRLDVTTADLSTPQDKFYSAAYLYDGQTKEMLATFSNKQGQKSASIFMDGWRDFAPSVGLTDLAAQAADKDHPEWDFATVQAFMDGVMRDRR